jgi:hypothetical protein
MISQSELTFMYAQLFTGLGLYAGDDSNARLGLGYFSVVPTILDKKYGSYAFSWSNLTATKLYREDNFCFTYADSYQFDRLNTKPVLSYGANLKYLRRAFSTDQRTENDPVFQQGRDSGAMTGDLGLLFRPYFGSLPGLKIGFAAQNITEPNIGLQETDRVPARYTLAFAYQDPRYRLLNPAIDFTHRHGRTIIYGGIESWMLKDALSLRVGGNPDELGGGLGYQFRLFRQTLMRLDYAIIWPINVSGTNGSQRLSITTNF